MSAVPEPVPIHDVTVPSGTVTFAFTDIEGSTVRWERDPAAMQDALRRHDALLRGAIAGHGGYVFKTIGDAFCSVFSRAQDAVAAMLEVQRTIAGEDFSGVGGLRVRAALHTGTCDERDGDYFGPTVNRVARLLAIGHGGQVLVSGVTFDLAQATLPPQAALRDLGEHRLKDLAAPEQVYQLEAPGLPTEFPALNSLGVLRNNLPTQVTSFVGREAEVAEIAALFGAQRLVTIVGSGGIGKTRTSLHVGADLLASFEDGVWVVELAPLANGEHIPTTIAQTLGLALRGDGAPLGLLVAALTSKRALLILDNCEHLVEPVAVAVAALLRGCPRLSVLASSRQALGIAGEAVYRMPTLAPATAIDLFAARAAAADHRFRLSDENAAVVGDICRRLDGIPLAIELAAARVKILSPHQLRSRLDERFRVLTGGSRDALPRQQTLRALIDWSYELLDERERSLFRSLGAFVNGFTLEGAIAVGASAALDELDVVDLLASLVDKSLVLAEPDGDALRYRMLESTRAYAREKLEAAGERSEALTRHLHFIRDLFVAASARYDRTAVGGEIFELLAAELEDVREALEWSAGNEPEAGGEMLALVLGGWASIGLMSEGLANLERFIALVPAANVRLLARLWTALADSVADSYPVRFLDAATRAVELAREAGDPDTLTLALLQSCTALTSAGMLERAAAAVAEAAEVGATTGPRLRLRILETQADVTSQSGSLEAGPVLERLRKTHVQLGNVSAANRAALLQAEFEQRHGGAARARELIVEVLPSLRANRSRLTLLRVALVNVCGYCVALDRLAEARDAGREALELFPQDADGTLSVVAVEHLALVAALEGETERAARLAAYSDRALRDLGFSRGSSEQATRTRLEALLAERLAPAEAGASFAEGAALSADEAIVLALDEPRLARGDER